MIRIATTTTVALLLAAVVSLSGWARGLARACDDPATAARIAANGDAWNGEEDRAAAEADRAAAEQQRRAPRAHAAPPTPPAAPVPVTPVAPVAPVAEVPEAPGVILPRGWFGFGLQCEECTATRGTDESPPVWRFYTLPRVYSVDRGGPAGRAGILRGDVLTHINSVSLLTPEGGRMFGATRAGDTVRWTVRRDDVSKTVVAKAEVRPERRERAQLRDLSRELERLNEMTDLDQLRRELAQLNRELEQQRREAARTRIRTPTVQRLRYAGVIGGTEVEVRGPGSVIVDNESKDELVISTGESVVVIRVADVVRKKKQADEPK